MSNTKQATSLKLDFVLMKVAASWGIPVELPSQLTGDRYEDTNSALGARASSSHSHY